MDSDCPPHYNFSIEKREFKFKASIDEDMNSEEIERRLCEHSYLRLDKGEPEAGAEYSLDEYWEKNKTYFTRQAETYLYVKKVTGPEIVFCPSQLACSATPLYDLSK